MTLPSANNRKQKKANTTDGASTEPPASTKESSNVSTLQSSGPCVYKDRCKYPGQTLYNCKSCGCRFHHLCGSQIGNSDDMNMCRENCDGTRPDISAEGNPTTPRAFVAQQEGVDIVNVDDDDDDSDDNLQKAKKLTTPPKKNKKSQSGTEQHQTSTLTTKDASRLKLGRTRKQSTVAEEHPKASEEKSVAQNVHIGISRPEAVTQHTSTEGKKRPKSAPARVSSGGSSGSSSGTDDDEEDFFRVGNRPSVNPAKLNHRYMVLPLYDQEPVVFLPSEKDKVPQVGVCCGTVYKANEHVWVIQQAVGASQPDVDKEVGPLLLRENLVVKQTDYVIYCGNRYCVFGPPLKSFCGVGWGTSWLDLVGEQRHFKGEDLINEKFLFELKRLDVFMMKYPDVPDLPVLVLGFIQNQVDHFDWKVVGLVNFINEGIISSETKAAANICYMTMSELKKEHAQTMSYVVEEVVEMYMTSHPTVTAYHQAMAYIRTWLRKSTSWLPRFTWRSKLQMLYPRQFSAFHTKQAQPKDCPKCISLKKQLDKANVSFIFSPAHVLAPN